MKTPGRVMLSVISQGELLPGEDFGRVRRGTPWRLFGGMAAQVQFAS